MAVDEEKKKMQKVFRTFDTLDTGPGVATRAEGVVKAWGRGVARARRGRKGIGHITIHGCGP